MKILVAGPVNILCLNTNSPIQQLVQPRPELVVNAIQAPSPAGVNPSLNSRHLGWDLPPGKEKTLLGKMFLSFPGYQGGPVPGKHAKAQRDERAGLQASIK